jgi:hypothetical protein
LQGAKPIIRAAELLGEVRKTLSLLEVYIGSFQRRVLEALRPCSLKGWNQEQVAGTRIESFVKLREELKAAIMNGHEDRTCTYLRRN